MSRHPIAADYSLTLDYPAKPPEEPPHRERRITAELPETSHIQAMTKKLHERDAEIAELRAQLEAQQVLATNELRFDGAMRLLVAQQSACGPARLTRADVVQALYLTEQLLVLVEGEGE